MSYTDNINGIPAQDTVLRQGIATLRNTVISNTIKPLTVDHNGVYTATPNNGTYGYSPVTVDTGVYTGATAPDNSIGKDGDHYYRVTNEQSALKDGTTFSSNSINKFIGFDFEPLVTLRPKVLKSYNSNSVTGKFIIRTSSDVIYDSGELTLESGWNNHTVTDEIELIAGTRYILAIEMSDTCGKYRSISSTSYSKYIGFKCGRWGSTDYALSYTDSSDTYSVDMDFETDIARVVAEYIKDNDAWITISSADVMVLSTLNATENGTYNAPAGTAYSSVSVNVGPEIISRSDWNALTTAQKQAKGLVVIQDASTGFKRGEYINGADYHDTLLQYSVYSDILEEDKSSTHESGTSIWGGLTLGGVMDNDADTAVITDGKAVSFNLSAANTSVTIYALMKRHSNTESGNRTLVGVPYAMNADNLPNIFCNGTTVNTSVYGSDVAISGISSTNYVLYTMAINAVSKKVDFYANGVLKRSNVWFSNSGGHIVFGAAETDLTNAISCNIKYIGIVDGYESENVIMNNHYIIMNEYDL